MKSEDRRLSNSRNGQDGKNSHPSHRAQYEFLQDYTYFILIANQILLLLVGKSADTGTTHTAQHKFQQVSNPRLQQSFCGNFQYP